MSQPDAEWRTITLRPVLRSVSELWKECVSLVSVDMGVGGNPHPSSTAIAEKIALIVKQHYEAQAPPEQFRDACAGVMRCWYPQASGVEFTVPDTGMTLGICGSFAHLESHHSIPKSQGLVGHASERIWLCSQHHRHVSDGVDGHDWRWLRQALGYTYAAARRRRRCQTWRRITLGSKPKAMHRGAKLKGQSMSLLATQRWASR